MPRIMRAFKMNEISAVDRPAQAHARAVIMKRAPELSAEDHAYLKRSFDAAERRSDAKSGAAMSDGSFPILDASDLSNAMRLAGHAKDPTAARAHIHSRAKALGLESRLSGAYAKGIVEAAHDALIKTLGSIIEDGGGDTVMLGKAAIEDFTKLLNSLLPADIIKALAADRGNAKTEDADMTEDEIKKAIDAAVAKATTGIVGELAETKKALAESAAELAVAKMAPEHAAHYAGLPEAERADFIKMDTAARAAKIAAKVQAIDPAIKKRLDEADADRVILKALQEKDQVATFEKRAESLGLAKAHGEVLRKAYAGDAAAQVALDKLLKGLAEQVTTGKVFAEFGTTTGADATTAKAEMDVKIAELRKVAPSLTYEGAFDQIYNDRQNLDIKKRFDKEEAIEKNRKLATAA